MVGARTRAAKTLYAEKKGVPDGPELIALLTALRKIGELAAAQAETVTKRVLGAARGRLPAGLSPHADP